MKPTFVSIRQKNEALVFVEASSSLPICSTTSVPSYTLHNQYYMTAYQRTMKLFYNPEDLDTSTVDCW